MKHIYVTTCCIQICIHCFDTLPASEITSIVSGGALNSTQTKTLTLLVGR